MLSTGAWSNPILRSLVPSHKHILCSKVTFEVKNTDQLDNYVAYSRTCVNGAPMKDNIDYTSSNSSIGSIDNRHLKLAVILHEKSN
jgi:hypothetical protein